MIRKSTARAVAHRAVQFAQARGVVAAVGVLVASLTVLASPARVSSAEEPSADLSITETAPATEVVGTEFTYMINLQNAGPAQAPAIVVQDTLPANVTFLGAPQGCGHDGAASGGTVTCNVSVPVGSNVPISLHVRATQTGPAVSHAAITNLGTNLSDPNTANNQATASTEITEPPVPSAPKFSMLGSQVGGAKICVPAFMDQDLLTQYWWVRAADGALQVNFSAVGVNANEDGSVTAVVYSPGGIPIASRTVAYSGLSPVPALPIDIATATPGALYRVEVRVNPSASGQSGRHYRLSANGASLIGTNSPLQPQAEGETARWRVNVAPDETLDLTVTPGPIAPLTTGSMTIVDPSGAVVTTVILTPGGTYASPSGIAPGQWSVLIRADHHYLLDKTSGYDRGLYLGWNATGFGNLSGTVTRNGGPNSIPVSIQIGAGITINNVTGTFSAPEKLAVGRYPVTIVGTSITATATVTCDGTASVTLDIPNTPPVAGGDSATTPEDTAATIPVLANDSDVDGGTLSVASVTQGANGNVAINSDGTVTYTPAANFNRTDTFTYTVSDGDGGTATAMVTVTVTPVNDPPVAGDDSATTPEDAAVTVRVLGNDSDVDGGTLSVASVTQGAHGSVAVNGDGTVTYTPAPNFNGPDTFTYIVSDGLMTDEAEVILTVALGNDAPVALDDTATTDAGTPVMVPVLANDTDIDGDTLTVTAVGSASNGTAVPNADGTITYAPAPGFSGTDTFNYTVGDGNGGEASAVVTVHVSQFAGLGRMTGGGTYATGSGKTATKQTWGFTLHCDGTKANLEFNDHATGGRFHLEQVLTTACSDDPSVEQLPPSAPLDTLYMVGRGRWNNVQGATIEVTLVDGGEPGTADSVRLTVWASDGSIVASVVGRLTGGNHQAHQ